MEKINGNLYFKTEIIVAIAFLVLCIGIFCCAKYFKDKDEVKKPETTTADVSLGVLLNNDTNLMVDVELTGKEKNELYELVNKLEFSEDSLDCLFEAAYYIKYDEGEFFLDNSCGMALFKDENKTVVVKDGGEELHNFLENKTKSFSNVSLFEVSQEDLKAKKVELALEEQEKIRNEWKKQNKESMKMNLIIIPKYILYIDGDMVGIEDLDGYVAYNNPYFASDFIMLNQGMKDVLSNYISDSEGNEDCCSCCPDLKPGESCIAMCCPCSDVKSFKMDDYKKEIDEFGPMFNKNKGTEIKTREDAIENAKKLWKDCLKFEENEKYPLAYDVSYDAANDCYLVRANVTNEKILGGGASLIIKSNGEVIALWGEN